jgi:hypothetical protein
MGYRKYFWGQRDNHGYYIAPNNFAAFVYALGKCA